MKKAAYFAIFAMVCLVFLGSRYEFNTASAQNNQQAVDQRADLQLADFIKIKTDRSAASARQEKNPFGGFSIVFDNGYQNVMLSKIGDDGEPVAACVTSLPEANAFLGRNLETGAKVESKAFEKSGAEKIAERHGMSVEEYQFYSKLIADAAQSRAENPSAATINIVNADGAGEGFNDPTAVSPEGGNNGATRGQQRLNLFEFAASIWSAYLDTNVPINIKSQFNPLSPCTTSGGVLGSAGAAGGYRDFDGAETTGTWYHSALANKQAGTDLDPSNPEINATFNSNVDNGCLGAGTRFYYGLDNTTPGGRINLLVVLLHEFGHGLGFSSFVNNSTGALANGFPDTYTRQMFDRSTGKFWYQMTDAERLASSINTNNVLWDGANVKIASGNLVAGRDAATGRVELFTPNPLQQGSSVSHFNTAASPNLLMEPIINIGLPIDLDLTRQVMRDIGWFRDTNADRIPDTITDVQVNGANLVIGSTATVTWTNNGGFNRSVIVELSTDGGGTYSTTLASNIANTGSYSFVVPNIATALGKVRVREYNFVAPTGATASNFTISNGAPCLYAITPPLVNVAANASNGSVVIATTAGCPWTANVNNNWLTVNNNVSTNGSGAATISYNVAANTGALRTGTITIAGQTFTVIQAAGIVSVNSHAPFDFDGDGKSDVSVFRPSSGIWYISGSQSGFYGTQFGVSSDKLVPADFDGDGKTDVAVYRPSNGTWYINRSSSGFTSMQFGDVNDVPVPADYDGDGKADIAVYRPSNGVWYITGSTAGFYGTQFGASTDKPVVGDYDGDGKADIAVFRPSNGFWYIQRSQLGVTGVQFGSSEDKTVAADYDGDGKTDIAVFRPSNGTWYLNRSQAGFTGVQFGASTDVPAAADYDGDGKVDVSVFRPSNGTWYIQQSANGLTGVSFGAGTDIPVANAFVY